MTQKILRTCIAMLLAFTAVVGEAQNAQKTQFPYPSVPDSIQDITRRYDFFVTHFWDNANLDAVLKNGETLEQTFKDYLLVMPQATPRASLSSIAKLTERAKINPKHLLTLADLADRYAFGDSAIIDSDEVYLAFIKPVVQNKKIKKEDRLRYAHQFTVLNNTRVGYPMGKVQGFDRTGTPVILEPDTTRAQIVFLSDPDCEDCKTIRARLKGNSRANELIKSGELEIIALCMVDPDDGWRQAAKLYPENWTVITAPDLDMTLDLRGGTPSFILMDHGAILAKSMTPERIMSILAQI